MKRSNQVLLTGIFLASVSSYAAKGQEVIQSYNEPAGQPDPLQSAPQQTDDTGRAHRYVAVHATGTHGHGFLHLFGHHHRQNSPPPAPTNNGTGPRTQGFGNTLRTTSAHSGHS